jgi:ATP synthase protein I
VPEPRGSLGDAIKYAQISTMLVAPVLAFGAVGYVLDKHFRTKPWFMLAGLLLGMVGGFVNFFRLVLPARDGRQGPEGRTR